MLPFLRRPLTILLLLLGAFVVAAGCGWLHAAPGTGEFYLAAGLTADLEQAFRSVHGIGFPWWTPNYLQGQTLAWTWSAAAALPLEAGRLLGGGQIIGYKVLDLLCLVAAGFTMYRFALAVTGSARTAAWAGACYALCPEFGLRLAGLEQVVATTNYPLIPLVCLALWRLRHGPAQDQGWPARVLGLALAYSFLFLLWAKAALLLLPVFGVWTLWLYLEKEEERGLFLFRLALAGLAILVLAGLPILPLAREQQWMTLFSADPMAQWQQAFALKTAFSWWDRGGAVLDPAPGAIPAAGGAAYVGVVLTAALALVLWAPPAARLRGWLQTREGTLCRLFLAAALLLQWISYGPFSVWNAHRQTLLHGDGLPNWSVTLLWLALAAQAAVVARLTATWSARRLVQAAVTLGFLFIPLFNFVAVLPPYSQLRAPMAFWDVGGSFCLAFAGALALAAVVERWAPPSRQSLAGWAAIALLLADASVYFLPFWRPTLPDGEKVYADFRAAERFLRDDPDPGSVVAFSSRYFYLEIPQATGRALHTEAGTAFYQLRWTRQLNDAGHDSREHFMEALTAGGVGFLVVDRTDPSVGPAMGDSLRQVYPAVFENAGFTVFRCPRSAAPALATGRVQFAPAANPAQALEGVAQDLWTIVPGDALAPAPAGSGGLSASPSTPLRLLQPRAADYQTIRVGPTPPGQPWVIVPESYHPDWTAEADGQPLAVQRALGCYLAARAPRDGAAVTFRFRPPGWYNGVMFVALAGWIAALGTVILHAAGRRRRIKR